MRPSDLKLLQAVETFARAQATAWTALAEAFAESARAVPPPPAPPPAPPPPTRVLVDTDVAAALGVSVFTVRAWRHKHIGPKYFKVGRAVRYRSNDVATFQANNTRDTVTGAADDRP